MRRAMIPFALVALILLPSAVAPSLGSWTTSASTPASFRPDRSVAFTYTVTSTSATDVAIDWMIHLWTCSDANADNQCTAADARLVDWTEKRLQASANTATSVTWSVTLPTPEATQLAYFVPRCTSTPCALSPIAGDTKARTFDLHYTSTWSRTLTVPPFAQNNSTSTVTYKLQSTSIDDPDLTGTADLFTTPNASAERGEGARTISVLANAQQTLSWTSIAFAPYGRQQERLVDSTATAWSFANASVLEVHLHAIQPRAWYATGSAFGLYFTLDGHGATPDPTPLLANVQLILRNGTFVLSNTTTRTDANGTLYQGFQAASDLPIINWTANTTVTWNGLSFAPRANGTIQFTDTAAPAFNTSGIDQLRQDFANQSLKGVHLDELGTHNLLVEIGRVTLYASIIAGVIFLVIIIAFRM